MATKKVKCNITGDWQYCNESRYQDLIAKYGSEEALQEEYTSRAGLKLLKEHDGDVEAARAAVSTVGKNKIACIVTGEKMFISPARLARLRETLDTDEDGVRSSYVSRVAKRLRKEAAQELEVDSFEDLTEEQQNAIDDALRARFESGDWPEPSDRSAKPEKVKSKPIKKAAAPGKTKVVTEVAALDPLRIVEGETPNERKNRVRRERRALAKLS